MTDPKLNRYRTDPPQATVLDEDGDALAMLVTWNGETGIDIYDPEHQWKRPELERLHKAIGWMLEVTA